ncbi:MULTISPECIES: PEP-CTERM sorting domain-containing protein [unclassified Duganella]|uniref:PEP-CTERM sorting domain-containing protein n=1 Tax=unclassified Duganella TaxID=2636909 RepID=UPI000E3564E7|nr:MULTISPECIES: PEP-CTERM sorting domain-containing protein [unclassified Duganella]RFP09981.1 PEP-CTERM sorting domain-containing protein [Duganella sp. BJB475]RFP25714.1 PEP-CTERM sorting domain-containing protein [Duganella sp. BJB476]
MIFVKRLTIAIALCATAGAAVAAQVDAPVASNAYITRNNLDWAWASPLPASSGLDLSYQSQFGWRLPTAAELANAPLATDFIFAGANVPLGGTDPMSGANFSAINSQLTGAAACAAPYFSKIYSNCDWQDGKGQPFGPWAGTPGAPSFGEQLVVRAVPEVDAYAMLLAGLGVVGAAVRRRRRAGA